ncbi:uncharacterized protein LOC143277791 [Babylonia areolata]|uniref:uncharacterized protein LOC143277791 n=1 Tax=Babylonia areolata TaxID=304850 RepID=UPI003FD5CE0C
MARAVWGAVVMVCLLVLFPSVPAQLDTSVCRQTPSNHSGPSLPALPEQYRMRVEANLVSKKTTVDVNQWHDGPGNRGAARVWLTSVLLSYVFSYPTQEKFSLEAEGDGRYGCQVSTLNTSQETYLYGTPSSDVNTNTTTTTTTSSNSSNQHQHQPHVPSHIYSAAEALSFGGAIAEHYEGRSTVRGMLTDVWRSCVFWQDLNATMTVRWYFTVGEEWDTAVGVGRVPVRCRVEGVVHSGPTPRPFLHLYEVTEFFSNLDGAPQVFETPAGTVCPHRKVTKAVPGLPDRFSYSSEVVDVESNSTLFIKTAYDNRLRLVMMERVSPLPPHPRLRTIDDFNTGVRYSLDLTRGRCSTAAIPPSDPDVISLAGASLPRMRTPQEFFFGLNASALSYEGVRNIEGVNTEVWVGEWEGKTPTTPTPTPTPPSPEILEFYFTTPEWRQSEGGGRVKTRVPVSIHVARNQQRTHQIQNVYNFRDSDPVIWDYDVTSCYPDSRQFQKVDFFFPVTSSQFVAVLTNQVAFRRALLDSVTSLATVTPMRVNSIQLQFGKGEVEVGVVLLEAANLTSSVMTSPRQETSLVVAVARVMDAVTQRELTVRLPAGNDTLILRASATSVTTTTTTSTTATATTTTTTTISSTTSTTTTTATASATIDATTTSTREKNPVCSPQFSGYTRGDVAGVAMGMAFAGYVLAMVAAALRARVCSLPSPPAYVRERLEMS